MAGANRGTTTLVVTIVVFVLASVFVALRMLSRWGIVGKVVSHDYLILLAWAIDFGFVFAVCYGTANGLGLHQSDVPPDWKTTLNTCEYVANVLYNPILMVLKTSILIFYLFLSKTNKIFKWAIFATIFVVNAAGTALTLVNIFQCDPVSAAIQFPAHGGAKCFSIVTIYLSSAPVNIITDIAIFFLPIPVLTQLRLPRKQKLILIITFSFGIFTAVVDVIRVAYLQSAATSRAINQSNGVGEGDNSKRHQDFSWYGAFTFMWSAVEINVGMICACVPSLKPLAARLIPRMIKGSTEESSINPGSGPRPNIVRGDTAPLAVPQLQGGGGAPNGRMVMAPRAYTDQEAANASLQLNAPSQELIDMSDFLGNTAPNEDAESSAATYPAPNLQASAFFDFVKMKKTKSMLAMRNKESIPPVAFTTILFFLWGIGYGFLDILNNQFSLVTGVSTWGSLSLHAAYYGGYLVSPLAMGRPILKRWGFKATFITGLFIYACGALIFWPSAVLTSFPPFVISNFIVGCGFGVLESAANPFISLCGPQENAEIRLNLSQAIQATGSIFSAALGEKVLFKSVTSTATLVRFQWTYLAIALFDLLLAAAFFFLPIPEATDEELQELADRRKEDVTAQVFGFPVIWVTFTLATFSQFWYVASQEVLETSFTDYVETQLSNTSSGSGGLLYHDYLLIGRGIFAFGRFVSALANFFFKPRWILMAAYIGLIIFAVLAKELRGLSGVVSGLILFFFESGVFSITFAMSLRGMGKHTKTAGAVMATAISGGAFYPFFQEIAQVNDQGYVPSSYVVLAVGYAAAAIFPVYLMLIPQAQKQVDPVLDDYLHRRLVRRGHRHRQSQHQHQHHQSERKSGTGDGTETEMVEIGGGVGSDDNKDNGPRVQKDEHFSSGGVLSRPRSMVDEQTTSPESLTSEMVLSASGVSVHDLAYEYHSTAQSR